MSITSGTPVYDTTVGTTDDDMVLDDATGTVSAKLAGMNFMLSRLHREMRQTNELLLLILSALERR